ncbi:MAG TPA: DUF1684 domain-containing protein [Chloroflexia bacterium]|nr:DUF1684 domain-containing protein [Chloroflexia bacterium]
MTHDHDRDEERHEAAHASHTTQATSDEDAAKRQLEAFRRQKDKFFQESEDSPLLHEDKHHFQGLNYYPVDLGYRVVATLVEEAHPGIFKVQTTTGDHKEYTRLGRLEFELDGQPLRLTAFLPPADEPLHGNRLFVPFRDKTSGKETYGAGRYIDLNKRASDQYVLDFNRAYNPYCAYSPYYSCPLPPGENSLPVEVRAGEKLFHDE